MRGQEPDEHTPIVDVEHGHGHGDHGHGHGGHGDGHDYFPAATDDPSGTHAHGHGHGHPHVPSGGGINGGCGHAHGAEGDHGHSHTVSKKDDHGHSHSGNNHGHSHGAAEKDQGCSTSTKLLWASLFCFVFMIGEIYGGYLAGSLAIMTDAAHLLSDLAGYAISLLAIWVAARPPTTSNTFGLGRVEAVGALTSIVLVWMLTGILLWEAYQRFIRPEPVDGLIMLMVSTAGLFVNIAMALILSYSGDSHLHSHGGEQCSGHGNEGKEDLVLNAAMIHVIGDLVQNIGVMLAAVVIYYRPKWTVADPICTVLFSILVLWTTIGTVKNAMRVVLNSTPKGIKTVELAKAFKELDGVKNVHDLHVWDISSKKRALTVHLVVDPKKQKIVLREALKASNAFGIQHSTIQIEASDCDLCFCYKFNDTCDLDGDLVEQLTAQETGGTNTVGEKIPMRIQRPDRMHGEGSICEAEQ